MLGLSPWHLAVLVVVGLVVFGPDKLPSLIKDLGKALRQVRLTAQTMQEDLKAELGPEVGDLDLRSLHPRTFVEKHLFGEDDVAELDAVLGTDFAKHEPAEPVSFDKPAAAELNEPEPFADQPAATPRVKFDADAT